MKFKKKIKIWFMQFDVKGLGFGLYLMGDYAYK